MIKIAQIFVFLFSTYSGVFAQTEGAVGTVTTIRGKVFKLVPTTGIKRKKIMLIKGMGVFEGDIIASEKNAYVELRMIDSTDLSLAPSSSFLIKKFRYIAGKERTVHYHQSWGSLRAKIKKKSQNNESVQFNTKHVEIGLQDSEFLSNSYFVNNKPTNDLLLLKGKAVVKVEENHLSPRKFKLAKGVLFNSNFIKDKGHGPFPRISSRILKMISRTRDFFLPRAQSVNGTYKDINWALEKIILQRRFLEINIQDQVTPILNDHSLFQSKMN